MCPVPASDICFERIVVKRAARELLVDGRRASVGARAFDVLLALVERRERVVGKDELLEAVWPHLVVEENNLQVQISALRRLLGPQAIATVPGRGYRFTLAETPPPGPLRLPAERTRFIGRAEELAACEALLCGSRLLTITGVGGVGKTRLAVTLARRVQGRYPDGVWFVDYSRLRDAGRVALAAADVFDVHQPPGQPLLARLVQHLSRSRGLVVLDNCEHLRAAVGDLADALLDGCPDLALLTTSREALGAAGEQCYVLPPMSLAAADPLASDAARLFVDRAGLVVPGFAPTAEEAVMVADICRRLDGIALAIELAAGRVAVLSPAQIRDRLHDRFCLVAAGRRSLPRHQTLRAAIQWSYDLLSADEQRLLRMLSVFAGGWTLEAAAAVAAGHEDETLEILSRLVDKSLVVVECASDGQARYRLLETVRDFARLNLDSSGEGGAARRRHLEYFEAQFRIDLRARLSAQMSARCLAQFHAELENVLAALASCGQSPDEVPICLSLVGGLAFHWQLHGLIELGYRVTLQALARPGAGASEAPRCSALFAASYLSYYVGDYAQARDHVTEGLAIARRIGDADWIAWMLTWRGAVLLSLDDADTAVVCAEALAFARSCGNPDPLGIALLVNAECRRKERALDAAEQLYDEYLRIRNTVGTDPNSFAAVAANRATLAVERGDAGQAFDRLQQAFDVLRVNPMKSREINALEACMALAAMLGDWERAERYLASAVLQREKIGFHREPGDEAVLKPWMDRMRTAIGVPTRHPAERGAAPFEDVYEEARAWIAAGPR